MDPIHVQLWDSRIQVDGWRKMEVAAQNRPEDGEEWSVAYFVPLVVTIAFGK